MLFYPFVADTETDDTSVQKHENHRRYLTQRLVIWMEKNTLMD